MAKQFLKYGGLLMSSALTVALFTELFGGYGQFYSWLMALSALALFEGGTVLWGQMIDRAKGSQRPVAKFSMWFCVGASIVSSCAQIIMSTNVWKPEGFDTGLLALFTIAGALAVNVIGIILFEFLDPDRAEKNKDLDRNARAQIERDKLADKVTEKAITKAGNLVDSIAGDVSLILAQEIQQSVVTYLLSQTQYGRASLPASKQVVDQEQKEEKPAPSVMDSIKARLDDVLHPASTGGMVTLAADGITTTRSANNSISQNDLPANWGEADAPVKDNGNGTHPKA